MATARTIVEAALLELNVNQPGESCDAADALQGLAALNRMVDQNAAESLQIFSLTRTTWTIVSNDGSYTVGSGGNVNVARPVFIDHVNFQDTSTDPDTEYQMQPLNRDAYARITQKVLTRTLPSSWYYNPTYPLGTLELYPVPTSATLQGVLYAPAAVAQFTNLTTAVSLPPGYEEFLVTNLAVMLASSYGRAIDDTLVMRAMNSKAIVKRANIQLLDMSFEAGALPQGAGYPGNWWIMTGP